MTRGTRGGRVRRLAALGASIALLGFPASTGTAFTPSPHALTLPAAACAPAVFYSGYLKGS